MFAAMLSRTVCNSTVFENWLLCCDSVTTKLVSISLLKRARAFECYRKALCSVGIGFALKMWCPVGVGVVGTLPPRMTKDIHF
jgi:hypothetical protein